MDEKEFKDRTLKLGLRILKLVRALPNEKGANVIGAQIVRSGTGIGANYRSACRAKSTAHMISKMNDVEEETDETLYWLEMIEADKLLPANRLHGLKQETTEILRMVVASAKTLKARQKEEEKAKKRQRRQGTGSSCDGNGQRVMEPRGRYNRKSKIGNRKS